MIDIAERVTIRRRLSPISKSICERIEERGNLTPRSGELRWLI
jgi:hypothetical protein